MNLVVHSMEDIYSIVEHASLAKAYQQVEDHAQINVRPKVGDATYTATMSGSTEDQNASWFGSTPHKSYTYSLKSMLCYIS